MRKILSILTIAIMVVFSSCELNEVPLFDDNDAFVAFEKASLSIAENGGTLNIPVTVASVKGVTSIVTYTIIDGTAKQGVNFTLVDGSATLNFDATNRTQYIQINIVNIPGVFTGDLKFEVKLSDDGTVKPSAEDVCTVTIQDNDHPLAAILGTYNVTAQSYWGSTEEFTMTILKDPKDISVVWIGNIAGIGDGPGFYGVVNEAKTQIAIPLGQSSTTNTAGSNGDGKLYLRGYNGTAIVLSGNMIVDIENGGAKLSFKTIGPALSAGGAGYYEILLPGYACTKVN
jgi:hypothetical protein